MWGEHVRVSGHFSGVQQGRRRLYSRRWDEVCAQASARQGWIEIYLSCQSLKGVCWIGQCTLSSRLSSNKSAKRASQVEHISEYFDIYLGDLQRDWWNDRDSRQERRRQDQLFWIQVQRFSHKKDFQQTNIFRQVNVPKKKQLAMANIVTVRRLLSRRNSVTNLAFKDMVDVFS